MLTRARGNAIVLTPFLGALMFLILAIAGDIWQWSATGLRPGESSYGASVFTLGFLNSLNLFTVALLVLFVTARLLVGRTDPARDRKSTRLKSSHSCAHRMPSSARKTTH